MSIVEKLKSFDWMRRPIKKIKIWREYFGDALDFSKYYMEEADKKKDYEYRMLMFVHNLEKGMCMPNPRPFGAEKARKLMNMVQSCENNNKMKERSCYCMSLSILYQWVKFHEEHNWMSIDVNRVKSFLDGRDIDSIKDYTGYIVVNSNDLICNDGAFTTILETRRAIRTFSDKPLDVEDVMECIHLSQMAPTACNRQMVKILQVSTRSLCDLITDTIYGAGGISRDTVNYFVITYDIKSLDYYGERNQGYVNSGLVAMNFANALHAKGIGSCFLQWANTAKEETVVKRAIGIPDNERIAIVIAAGYYDDKMLIARSHRRDMKEIYRVVE